MIEINFTNIGLAEFAAAREQGVNVDFLSMQYGKGLGPFSPEMTELFDEVGASTIAQVTKGAEENIFDVSAVIDFQNDEIIEFTEFGISNNAGLLLYIRNDSPIVIKTINGKIIHTISVQFSNTNAEIVVTKTDLNLSLAATIADIYTQIELLRADIQEIRRSPDENT